MCVVVQAFNYNLRTEEAEAGDLSGVWGHSALRSGELAKNFSRQGFSLTHFYSQWNIVFSF